MTFQAKLISFSGVLSFFPLIDDFRVEHNRRSGLRVPHPALVQDLIQPLQSPAHDRMASMPNLLCKYKIRL